MKIDGKGTLLRIFVGERDRRQGQPLYTAIVDELRRAGLAGASVFKGIMDGLVHEGMVTLESVEIIHYRAGSPDRPPQEERS